MDQHGHPMTVARLGPRHVPAWAHRVAHTLLPVVASDIGPRVVQPVTLPRCGWAYRWRNQQCTVGLAARRFLILFLF